MLLDGTTHKAKLAVQGGSLRKKYYFEWLWLAQFLVSFLFTYLG